MADLTNEQKILDYLKQCQGGKAEFSDFCNIISVQKKSLHKYLRQLKRKKLVSENRKTTPPTWSLCVVCEDTNQAEGQANASAASQWGAGLSSLKKRIVTYLASQRVPRSAIDVARSLDLPSKKSINPALYRLERDQVLVSDSLQGRKPLWRLSDKARAMSEELFRDSSEDFSAPGAYSPEKCRVTTVHAERQQLRRSHSKPYDHAHHDHRHRSASGSGSGTGSSSGSGQSSSAPTIPHAPVCQEGLRQNDSGVLADQDGGGGGGGDDATFRGGELTVTLSADGKGRDVAVGLSEEGHGRRPDNARTSSNEESSHGTERRRSRGDPTQKGIDSRKASVGEGNKGGEQDYRSDVDEEEDDFEPRDMAERFQDMMGDLAFADLTYVEDVDMPEEGATLLPNDIVLLQLSLEPRQAASAAQLALALQKQEEEIVFVLSSCQQEVTECGDGVWRLTPQGAAWAREKQAAFPSVVHQLKPSGDFQSSSSVGLPSLLPPPPSWCCPSQGHPPPSPHQLISMDPSAFGSRQPPQGAAAEKASSSSTMSQLTTAGQGSREGGGGAALARDGDSHHAGPRRPAAPPSLSRPPLLMPPSSSSSVSSSSLMAPQYGFQPIHPAEQRAGAAGASSAEFAPPRSQMWEERPRGAGREGGEEVVAGDGRSGQGLLRPQGQLTSLSSLDPSLHRFAEEGLTVVPMAGARAMMEQPALDILERQLGSTGIAANSMFFWSLAMPTGNNNNGGSSITTSSISGGGGGYFPPLLSGAADLPRSHSQPQLDVGGEAAGEGPGGGSMLQITSESFAALNKNPISALMEYAQSRRLQAGIEVVSQRGPSHRPVFLMAAKVGSRQFPGVTCSNKKDGRKEAADVALRTLIAEGQYTAVAPTPSLNVAPEAMTHFDKVAALTHQAFNTLIATIPENLAGRKVIAGLVMKRSPDDVGVVISIGTGNRCITGDKLSLEGNTVNDSHAEIITRRGFLRFLYQQLEKYEPGKEHELFEEGVNAGQLKVKDGITFHLYISTAPCGDGALFSPRDVEANSAELKDVERREHHPTFTSNVQGLLRTKMEGGEGTIPVDRREVTIQTWDGVVRGERLRTMSCTDKISRWNVLGLQGALLSHFLEPIYLHSLTLGFLYDHGHLSRAVCCRLARAEPPLDSTLPPAFQLNHPWLGRVTACQPLRETQKTKAFSINWTIGDHRAEVLDGTLGHCYTQVENRLYSRLAKRCLYDSFKSVARRLGREELVEEGRSYHHNKQAATAFQQAKAAMVHKFQQLGCGWVSKPVEEEMFS